MTTSFTALTKHKDWPVDLGDENEPIMELFEDEGEVDTASTEGD